MLDCYWLTPWAVWSESTIPADRVPSTSARPATRDPGPGRGHAAGLCSGQNRIAGGSLRLAKALSALYPKDNEEKRSVDAILLAVPR